MPCCRASLSKKRSGGDYGQTQKSPPGRDWPPPPGGRSLKHHDLSRIMAQRRRAVEAVCFCGMSSRQKAAGARFLHSGFPSQRVALGRDATSETHNRGLSPRGNAERLLGVFRCVAF